MKKHLSVYLNDHLAGSVAALELLKHLEGDLHGMPLAKFFSQLREDILSDRRELEAMMARLEISTSTARKLTSWVAEKVAEIKLWLDDPSARLLHLLEATEALSLGIEGKRLLWRSLAAADRPEQRALEQRDRVEDVRLWAAQAALAEPVTRETAAGGQGGAPP